MAERVDVCIVGSGFGGSIAAWRLAELYQPPARTPGASSSSNAAAASSTPTSASRWTCSHLSSVYNLIQSSAEGTLMAPGPSGGQIVTANAVGGGSNLYLAASIRSPTETFERRDHRADDGEDRRMWPGQISRKALDPYYARRAGAAREAADWKQVSKSGGLWAATLDAAGHSCDRVPLAIDPKRCVDAKWCHTGCIFGAKNTVLTNYLGAARSARASRSARTAKRRACAAPSRTPTATATSSPPATWTTRATAPRASRTARPTRSSARS